jgi:23S rRNA (uracil1939-C5)-methyltransferase
MARPPEPNRSTSPDVSPDILTIDHLSAAGEGVFRKDDGSPVFVPMALPGETVRLDEAGRLVEVVRPSLERANPFCSAFGRCGGCATQHMNVEIYARWKRALVQRALLRDGFDIEVQPVIMAHGEGRRRAIVHVRFGTNGPVAGFMAARTHDLQALATCPVLVPALKDVFAVARAAAAPLAGRNKPLDVQVTATLAGLDVDIRGHGEPNTRERQSLIDGATTLDLARLSIHRDVIVERRPPTIDVGGTMVALPPRAFLQATTEAEQALGHLVLESVGKARSVADLFCGVGPFALRLAQTAKVHAADDGKEAVAALDRAARNRQGLKPILAETRDLFRRPLLPTELNSFDSVVMDPPRAGAEAQARQIAASKVKQVVSVSCDLQSFIRDGLILKAAGFRLVKVTPVDQFAWSRHIELVGDFRR